MKTSRVEVTVTAICSIATNVAETDNIIEFRFGNL